MLIPELDLNDWWFHLGPESRIALMAACDANAWLGGVGTLDATGALSFDRLEVETEIQDRIAASGNAGFSVSWTADGSTLFVDTTRVDAATGKLLSVPELPPDIQVHAELADGSQLVSRRSDDRLRPFWFVETSERLDEVTTQPPDVVGQTFYPAVQIRLDPAGERAFATFEDWEDDSTRTVVVGGDELWQLDGHVWPSPSGKLLLVREVDRSDVPVRTWSIVDPVAGTRSPIPLPVDERDQHVSVLWGGSDAELLVSAHDRQFFVSTPSRIWVLPLA